MRFLVLVFLYLSLLLMQIWEAYFAILQQFFNPNLHFHRDFSDFLWVKWNEVVRITYKQIKFKKISWKFEINSSLSRCAVLESLSTLNRIEFLWRSIFKLQFIYVSIFMKQQERERKWINFIYSNNNKKLNLNFIFMRRKKEKKANFQCRERKTWKRNFRKKIHYFLD